MNSTAIITMVCAQGIVIAFASFFSIKYLLFRLNKNQILTARMMMN